MFADASTDLLDILTGCLQVDPEKRMDSTALVAHDFFKTVNDSYKELNEKKVYTVFMNCRHFKPTFLCHMEIVRHMVGRFLFNKEKEFLKKIFDALDDEKDGELEPHEFIDQFKEKFKLTLGIKDMHKMLRFMDVSGGDGLIQFSEFLVAGCDKRNLLSTANVEKEFDFLDQDQDGYIGPEDMEKFMTNYVDPDTIDNDEDCQDYYKMMIDLKKANLTIKKETALALNEDTVVKNFRWSGLKKHAMKDDFESS